jgi:hypothetical protein
MASDTVVRRETGTPSGRRASISAATLRRDRWWVQPAVTAGVLFAFVVYATWAAFVNGNYWYDPYLSPFYSPCIAANCVHGAPSVPIFGSWWPLSPAVIILIVPLGFRLTCYYYRKAYYRSFWLSPPACAVAEPHRRYTGGTRFPLALQNVHRYFWYLGLALNVVLTADAVLAFNFDGHFGIGLGSAVLTVNAVLLWTYSLSCHSCRHIVGGRLSNFGKHPLRYWMWTAVSRLNAKHMQFAWMSLVFVALTDLYVRLLAAGALSDPRWVSR